MPEQAQEFEGKYLTWGPPGTGKTTWAARKVRQIIAWAPVRANGSSPVTVCSLTRTAAAELGSRDMSLPSSQIGTLHSLAYKSIEDPDIAEAHVKEWNGDSKAEEISDTKPIELDDMNGVDPPSMKTKGDEHYQEYCRYRARMIDRDMWRGDVRRFAKRWEEWKKANSLVDFTDLIEICIDSVPAAPGRPGVIIADEAQDLSKLEQSLLNKWSKQCRALILIGDPYQALYTWRGADPEFLFTDLPDNPQHRRLLNRSYRVPERVRAAAMNLISKLSTYRPIDYKARPLDPEKPDDGVEEGEVRFLKNVRMKQTSAMIPEIEEDLKNGLTVMIESTCGYMLKSAIADLREAGIPFANPWRLKNGAWNPIKRSKRNIGAMDRLMAIAAPHRDLPRDEHDDPAHMWKRHEFNMFASLFMAHKTFNRGGKTRLAGMAKENPSAEFTVEEMLSCFEPSFVESIMDLIDKATPLEMIHWALKKMLPKKKATLEFPLRVIESHGFEALRQRPKVYVGTVHSFKGAEADSVYLFTDLSPSATQSLHTKEGRDSIIRGFYVAMTRSRKRLSICRPSSGMSVNLRKYC